MKPTVAVFTRDNPCSKLEIWNCFRARRGFKKVQVDAAKAIIGENAPKNMLSRGYIEVVSKNDVESYELTEDGREWLTTGMTNFVRKHPQRVPDAVYLPKSIAA